MKILHAVLDVVAWPVLIGLAVLLLLLAGACTTVDKALLEPERDETGQALYVDQAGTVLNEAEVQRLPPAEREKVIPLYQGPKDFSDEAWGAVEYSGVSLGGLAAIAASVWWALRRRRKPTSKKGAVSAR